MAQPIIAGIFVSVSTSLNDQESGFPYVRWPVVELTGYFNESLTEIGNYRPDAFMVTMQVTLAPGSQQSISVATGARLLKSIDYNGDTSLCPGYPVTECDLNLMRSFYKEPCNTGDYKVLSYAYDAKNPNIFYVSPPVPAGDNGYVVGTFVLDPDQFTHTGSLTSLTWTPSNDLTIDQMYYNAIKFWMLARAYEVDTESSTSQVESEKYYKKFYNLLGVQYKQTSAYNKGLYSGQGGDNQMTKQRPE